MTDTTVFTFDEVAKESSPFAKWTTPGDRYVGIIENPRWLDNNFRDEPGQPEKHFAFDVNDDGTITTVQMDKADLRRAIREGGLAAKVNGIKAGDYIEIEYIGDGVAKPGLSAPKLFSCLYVPANFEAGA